MDPCGPLLERIGTGLMPSEPGGSGSSGPVVVACSGGADSVALLALAVSAGLGPVAVHVDHRARPDSGWEAAHVAFVAARLGAGFEAETVAVPLGPGFEARAREARYAALERARARVGAEAVLVGHTRDDQAETVLLNVLRGGATTGLAGIPPVLSRVGRGPVRRPLLGIPKADLLALCAALGLPWLDDPMNADAAYRRIWLRREVLPALERGADRDLRAVLARQAQIARAEDDLLDALAGEALAGLGEPLDAGGLAALERALARRVVRLWLGPPPVPFEHVEAVLDVAAGRVRATDLPGGLRVARSGGRMVRTPVLPVPSEGGLPRTPGPRDAVPMDLPGCAAGFGVRLVAWVERAAPLRWPDGRWMAVLDADRVGDHASLRGPRPGERFQPLGLTGTKPVFEALAEAGVPAEERSNHPVLAGALGEALWVVGYRIDHRVRVDVATRRFLWVKAEAGGNRT